MYRWNNYDVKIKEYDKIMSYLNHPTLYKMEDIPTEGHLPHGTILRIYGGKKEGIFTKVVVLRVYNFTIYGEEETIVDVTTSLYDEEHNELVED